MCLLNDLDYNLYQLNITGEAKGYRSCESCRYYFGDCIGNGWHEPMGYEAECGIESTIATLHNLFKEYTGEINGGLANYCPLYEQVLIGQEENDSYWDEPLSPDEIKTIDDLYRQAEEARHKEQR